MGMFAIITGVPGDLLAAWYCRTGGVVFYLNPQPRLDPRKNQNGTMAKGALLPEKFISSECVR